MKKDNKRIISFILILNMMFSLIGIGNINKVLASAQTENKIAKNYKNELIFDALSFDLKINDTHRIVVLDTPRAGWDNQATMRGDLIWSITSGKDVISIDQNGVVKGIKEGTAIIEVTYPGLEYKGVVVANVIDPNKKGPTITTTIKETKYDILYFTEDSYNYNFKINSNNAENIEVEVNGVLLNPINKNSYKAQLKDGYNIIKISALNSKGKTTKVYNIRAKKLDVHIDNLTRKGEEILEGDKIKISFTGLVTPVPKISRIFNPSKTCVKYKTDMPRITEVSGQTSQYYIATQNAVELEVTDAGEYTFSSGYIYQEWWGDELNSERYIGESAPNMGAPLRECKCSVLPDIKIKVKKNSDYKRNLFNAFVENKDNIYPGSEVTLKIENLKKPVVDQKIWSLYTTYTTNIPERKVIKSEDAVTNESNLSIIKFNIPKDTPEGEYIIKGGYIYVSYGMWSDYTKEKMCYQTQFPDIKINVKKAKTDEYILLLNKISQAKNIEKGNYTDETWNLLKNAILDANKIASNKNANLDEINKQINLLDDAIKNLTEKKEEKPDKPKLNASITPEIVEVLPGETFKLSIKSSKGNYFVYNSEVPVISSEKKEFLKDIKFTVSKDAKPGKYKLSNLSIYDINTSILAGRPYPIQAQLLAGMFNDENNKVSDLSDVTVIVKDNKEQKVDLFIEGYKGLIANKQGIEIKDGDTVEKVIETFLKTNNIKFHNRQHYIAMIDNQREFDRGQTSGWKYSINGVIQPIGISECILKPGDKIKVFFVESFENETGYRDVDEVKLNKNTLKLQIGQSEKLNATILPNNATNKKILWTSSDNSIATVDENGNVKALGNGEAIITASSIKVGKSDVKEQQCKIVVNDKKEDTSPKPSKDYNKIVNDNINILVDEILKGEITDGWQVLELNKLGRLSDKQSKDYLKYIVKDIKENKEYLSSTDLEKMIIGIVAAGGNPSNIGGFDLVKDLLDKDLTDEGVNGQVFGLIALDAVNLKSLNNAKFTKEELIKSILENRTNDNGWAFGSDKADADMTSMALTALEPYYNKRKDVKEAIDKAVEVLSKIQKDNGTYTSWGAENSNSISMAIVGLSTLGIDIVNDKRFIKNGNNLIDALMKFKLKGKIGFGYNNNNYNDMATEQALRAFVAYKNLKEGKDSIYKFNLKQEDVVKPDETKNNNFKIENITEEKEFKLGTHAKVSVKAINNTKETKGAELIVGIFDKDGQLVNYGSVYQDVESNKNVKLKVMLNIPTTGEYTVKAFVWDSLDNMKALSNVIEIPVN